MGRSQLTNGSDDFYNFSIRKSVATTIDIKSFANKFVYIIYG
nr:MAG TPA: hypothetical protein [Caudoviricetes sp.]